jgi:uncharacterized protein
MNLSADFLLLFDGNSRLEQRMACDTDCYRSIDSDCCDIDCYTHICPLPTTAPLAPHTLLQRHPALQTLPLDAEHMVAFVPSLSQVAVLNHATLSLLDTYATPQPWQHAPLKEQELLQQCYHLGLLQAQHSDTPAVPPLPSQALVVWLHITNACNLRCTYCYVEKTNEMMSGAVARAAVDAVLRSAVRHGYTQVCLKYAGGEASMCLPLVAETHTYALAQAERLQIQVTGGLLSNGTLLSPTTLQQLCSLGLHLSISLDGMEAVHDRQRPMVNGRGSFRAVLKGIERALDMGLLPSVTITVTEQSVAGLPDLVRWLLVRKVRFTFNFCRPVNQAAWYPVDEEHIIRKMRQTYAVIAEHLPDYPLLDTLLDRTSASAPHHRPCMAGESYLVIDHHGHVFQCHMERSYPVATLATPDLLDTLRTTRSGIQNPPVDEKEACRTCQWRYWCAGGCPVTAFHTTGRYDMPSPYCRVYQALYPDLLRLEGLRLLSPGL